MFTVVTIALHAVISALVGAKGIGIGRVAVGGAVGDVGIHIPHLPVGFVVGGVKCGPQTGIGDYRMTLDDIVECRLKGYAGLAVRRIVISRGDLGRQVGDKKKKEEEECFRCTEP